MTKDKIAPKDLSLSSTADEDILFSAKGEKVMSLSNDEHVNLGDQNLVHVLEVFNCKASDAGDAQATALVLGASIAEANTTFHQRTELSGSSF